MKQLPSMAVHTSSVRHADDIWLMMGGHIEPIRRTGELRYSHAWLERPLRVNGRRHDVPAKLLTFINRIRKLKAANDPCWQ